MSSGVVSVRYARALLKASIESRQEDQIFAEMKTLQQNLQNMPGLQQILDNPTIPSAQKADILQCACGNSVNHLTQHFISLLFKEGREKAIISIINSYIALYRKSKNMIDAKVITAVPLQEETANTLRAKIMDGVNGNIEFKTDVSPEIIGGFILEYDTYRMDASIKKQLDSIRTQLTK